MPTDTPPSQPGESPGESLDPVFVHARREAFLILGLYGLCFLWAIPICWFCGYLPEGEELTQVSTILGMPSWTFWGIALPWLGVDLFTVWFCFFHMKNDDLGEEAEAVVLEPAPQDEEARDA